MNTLDIFDIIMWVSIGGVLGGIAEYLRRIAYRDGAHRALVINGHELFQRPFILLLVASAIIGLSGALAFQFILISLKWISLTHTPEDILFLLSVSVAAGFGARILLPEITERLRDQLKKLRAETDQLTTKAEGAAEKAEAAATEAKQAAIITRAVAALTPGTPVGDKKSSIKELMPIHEKEPKTRRFVILLGRLHRALKDYPTAISVLENFIALKEKDDEHDDDYAAALYNRACYWRLLWEKTTEETKKEEYKKMALESLARSIKISEENKADAKSDPDFDKWKNDPEFKKVIE